MLLSPTFNITAFFSCCCFLLLLLTTLINTTDFVVASSTTNCTAIEDIDICNNDGTCFWISDYPSPNGGFCFFIADVPAFEGRAPAVLLTQAQCHIANEYTGMIMMAQEKIIKKQQMMQQDHFSQETSEGANEEQKGKEQQLSAIPIHHYLKWCDNIGRCSVADEPCACSSIAYQLLHGNTEKIPSLTPEMCKFVPIGTPDAAHWSSLCKWCPGDDPRNSSILASSVCVPNSTVCGVCGSQTTKESCGYFEKDCSWCDKYDVCLDTSFESSRDKAAAATAECKCEDISTQITCQRALDNDTTCQWCPTINRCVTPETSSSVSPCSQCGYAIDANSCIALNNESGTNDCSWCSFRSSFSFTTESFTNISLCQNVSDGLCSCSNLDELQCSSIAQEENADEKNKNKNNKEFIGICSLDDRVSSSSSDPLCTSSASPQSNDCTFIPNEGDCLNSELGCKWCEEELGGGCVNNHQECSCYNLKSSVCPTKGCQECREFDFCFKKTDKCVCAALSQSQDLCARTDSYCEWDEKFSVCMYQAQVAPTICNQLYQGVTNHDDYRFVCEKASSQCKFCANTEACVAKESTCSCISSSCSAEATSDNPFCQSCTSTFYYEYPSPANAELCINTSDPNTRVCDSAKYCYDLTHAQCLDSQLNSEYCTWCPELPLCIATMQFNSHVSQSSRDVSPLSALNAQLTCSCNSIRLERYCSSSRTNRQCKWCSKLKACIVDASSSSSTQSSSSAAAAAAAANHDVSSCSPVMCEFLSDKDTCDSFGYFDRGTFSYQGCRWQMKQPSPQAQTVIANTFCENMTLVESNEAQNLPYCSAYQFKHSCLAAGCLWCDEGNNADGVLGCVSYPVLETVVPEPNVYCSCRRFNLIVTSANGRTECENRNDFDRSGWNPVTPPLPAFQNTRCQNCYSIGVCLNAKDGAECSCQAALSNSAAVSKTLDIFPSTIRCSYCLLDSNNNSKQEQNNQSHNTVVQNRQRTTPWPDDIRCTCESFAQTSCQDEQYSSLCGWCSKSSSVGACVNITSDNNSNLMSDCTCENFSPDACPNNYAHTSCQVCNGSCIGNAYGPPQITIADFTYQHPVCLCHSILDKSICNNRTNGDCYWQEPILVGSSNKEGYCGYANTCQNPLTCSSLNQQSTVYIDGHGEINVLSHICVAAGCEFNEVNKQCTSFHNCFIFFLPSFVIQPVALLMIGFVKDVLVLMLIGAFGDVLARNVFKKFSSVLYKIRNWDEDQIQNSLDETVYIMDERCVDSDSFKFIGEYCDDISFEEYSKKVTAKLFDINTKPEKEKENETEHQEQEQEQENEKEEEAIDESKVKMLTAAVNFALVDSGLWINLDSDLSKISTTNNVNEKKDNVSQTEETKLLDAQTTLKQTNEELSNEQEHQLPILLDNDLFNSRVLLQKHVSQVVTQYSTAFVFYARSREIKRRVASCFNSFPSSLQLMYYVTFVALMALSVFYSVAIQPENRDKVEQIASFTCHARDSSKPSNFTPTTFKVGAAETSFFLIGFRLLNASALSTAMLILVKTIRGLFQTVGSKFDGLSLTRQLPLLGLYSSRSVHILLGVYFMIFAPFIFVGVAYGPNFGGISLMPVSYIMGPVGLIVIYGIYKWVSVCWREFKKNKQNSTREQDSYRQYVDEVGIEEQTDKNEYDPETFSNPDDDDDDNNNETNTRSTLANFFAQREEKRKKIRQQKQQSRRQSQLDQQQETSSTTSASQLRVQSSLLSKKTSKLNSNLSSTGDKSEELQTARINQDDDNNKNTEVEIANNDNDSKNTEVEIANNDKDTHDVDDNESIRNKNVDVNNNDEELDHIVPSSSLASPIPLDEEEQNKIDTGRMDSSVTASLLSFLFFEELPTIACTLAFQMSFNYTVLQRFADSFGTPSSEANGGGVVQTEWNYRSLTCIAEGFEGDLSGAWSSLTSFLPFS